MENEGSEMAFVSRQKYFHTLIFCAFLLPFSSFSSDPVVLRLPHMLFYYPLTTYAPYPSYGRFSGDDTWWEKHSHASTYHIYMYKGMASEPKT